MKFWILAPWIAAEEMVELAKLAETLGFEGMTCADHAFIPREMAPLYPYSQDGTPPLSGELPYPDTWVTLSAMAAVTTRLKLSVAVYILPLRHPIEVARASGTLARISDNRLVLSIGIGWMKEEFDVYGIDFKTRGRRTDEAIEVLRKLWRGGYTEHHGEFYDFPQLQLAPAPAAEIPIYVGGSSKAALRRAARLAQGWLGTGHTVSELYELLPQLQQLRIEYGREKQSFTILGTPSDLQDAGALRQLEEQGMNAVSFGFAYSAAEGADERRRAMEEYAENIIVRYRTREI